MITMISPVGASSVYFGKIRRKPAMRETTTPAIGLTRFARDRYTPESHRSHFDGSWRELQKLVSENWANRKQAPNNAQVFLVPVPQNQLHRFHSGTMTLDEDTPLVATFAPRREGEDSYIQVNAAEPKKSKAQSAEIVVYSHAALAADEKDFADDAADYYIVAVNAYPTKDPEPMRPETMARNLLGLPGGTRPDVPYSPEDFAKAIMYWSQHV